MHMADALISPVVGGAMWAATAGVAAYSIKKVQTEMDEKKIPLMGVMGAFIFASQMINFTIPATGSSGHIGGGLILAILLGPYAGFLTIASVLAIQALFFADGGLLAYGCNVFNMGFFSCFIAYPLIYKVLMKKEYSTTRIFLASVLTAVIGLQLGAFGVVLETLFSGKTELPFGTFVLLMQPIHLAIGVVEGLVTAAIATYIWNARPEIMEKASSGETIGNISIKKVVAGLVAAAVVTGAGLSWFASSNPDGLEWAMIKTAGTAELEATGGLHQQLSDLQSKTAFLPDYSFKASEEEPEPSGGEGEEAWPAVDGGTSTSGLVGGSLTLILAALVGGGISLMKRRKYRINS
ncbi:energy-coupling factor ABC transporter permease [Desulfosporosinus hippei]|uniref:Cobalt/nickel transport system permease protein n=1 Tax=Desulfosporosinus hippei DSM 8344 TaxID=1121419 RepID=A0A1G7T8X8_9FIRM|nr:energy-coupling factor ABC transporter permease [Desulfosporosinus hippei]SDG31069.1 cobalt/nickel transport system permease protein [Desulfosporosinus hippei DSM 8344]